MKKSKCFLLMPQDDVHGIGNAYSEAVRMDFSLTKLPFLPSDVIVSMQAVSKQIERGNMHAAVTQVEELRARMFEYSTGKSCLRRAWAGLMGCERGQIKKYLEKNAAALMEV